MGNPANGRLMTPSRLTVSVAVADIETMSAWYHTYFGFNAIVRREFADYGVKLVWMEADNCRLEFIEDKNVVHIERPDPPRHTMISGISQITFYVDDMDATVRRVDELGLTVACPVIDVPDMGWKVFFIRDPENNVIQFVEFYEKTYAWKR